MTLSRASVPIISSCFPETFLARFRRFAKSLYRISLTSELFPEPETPVTTVMIPSGISTSIFLRLCSLAPFIVSQPVGCLRSFGTGMHSLPLRYWPVMESGQAMISSGVPAAMTSPPSLPARGPISTR